MNWMNCEFGQLSAFADFPGMVVKSGKVWMFGVSLKLGCVVVVRG